MVKLISALCSDIHWFVLGNPPPHRHPHPPGRDVLRPKNDFAVSQDNLRRACRRRLQAQNSPTLSLRLERHQCN